MEILPEQVDAYEVERTVPADEEPYASGNPAVNRFEPEERKNHGPLYTCVQIPELIEQGRQDEEDKVRLDEPVVRSELEYIGHRMQGRLDLSERQGGNQAPRIKEQDLENKAQDLPETCVDSKPSGNQHENVYAADAERLDGPAEGGAGRRSVEVCGSWFAKCEEVGVKDEDHEHRDASEQLEVRFPRPDRSLRHATGH